jgi:hypothetical protein
MWRGKAMWDELAVHRLMMSLVGRDSPGGTRRVLEKRAAEEVLSALKRWI